MPIDAWLARVHGHGLDRPTITHSRFAADAYSGFERDQNADIVNQWMAPWRERSARIRTTGEQSVPTGPVVPVVLPSGADDLYIAATLLDTSGHTGSRTDERRHEPLDNYTHAELVGTVALIPQRHFLPAGQDANTTSQHVFSEHEIYSTLGYHRNTLWTADVCEYDEDGVLKAFFEQTAPSWRPLGAGCSEVLAFPEYSDDGLVSGWCTLRTSGEGGVALLPRDDARPIYRQSTHVPAR